MQSMANESNPIVLFVATEKTTGVCNFIYSLEHFKQEYTHLCLGKRWQGWQWRMQMYIAALKELEPNRWVATSDADDVLCARRLTCAGLESLTDGKPDVIIASAETFCGGNCVPLDKYWKARNNQVPRNAYTHANGGGIVGRAKDMLTMYTWMLASGDLDDQRALGKYANFFPDRVVLDSYAQELAVVMAESGHKTVFLAESQSIQRSCGVTKPALLHFPGKFGYKKLLYLLIGQTFRTSKDEFGKRLLRENYIDADQGFSFSGHVFSTVMFCLLSCVLILFSVAIYLAVKLSRSRTLTRTAASA